MHNNNNRKKKNNLNTNLKMKDKIVKIKNILKYTDEEIAINCYLNFHIKKINNILICKSHHKNCFFI